jgi:poly-gamma-glutamate synthesis protein (capsule biosynthesis protein)
MRVAFVGDIALGDHPKTVGFGFRSRYRDGIPAASASRLRPPGAPPDLVFGNLEFPLDRPVPVTATAQWQCRGIAEYAAFLSNAGISALNVANNHSYQHGPAAFDATIAALRAAGIHVVGTPADFSETGVLTVRGRRVAFLGWSDRPRQYDSTRPPYNELTDAACNQIAEAKRRADLVIASVHWGDEFILVPSDRERSLAHAMIDAGANFVIGHHPHVVREVEYRGNGVIAYSLGNFVGDMLWDPGTRFTSWLTADIDERNVAAVELTPGVIDDDYLPRPLTAREKGRLLPRFAAVARRQRARLSTTPYARVAENERRRHAWRTAGMMLRNLHRYPRRFAFEAFRGAISHRLRALFSS